MKEYILTQPYSNMEEMLNSAEVGIYKEELSNCTDEEYAIISRIGNRYDIFGNKIENYAINPFITKEIKKEETETTMKYAEIETLIDNEIAKAITSVKAEYEKEIAEIKTHHEEEMALVKENIKAEIIAMLNS